MDRFADHGKIGDTLDELEELGRADNRVGNGPALDQLFLSDLRAKIAAVEHSLASHHRQCDVMLNARPRFLGEKIPRGCIEKIHYSIVFPRRSIRYVNHYRCSLQRLLQSLTREGIDTGIGRCRDHFVPMSTQLEDKL